MPCSAANRWAVTSLREATATTAASGTSRRSATNFAAMRPVATMPHRIGAVTGSPEVMASISPERAEIGYGSRLGSVDAYLIDAVRTPFGKHRGGVAGTRTDDLAATPVIELLKRHPGLDPARVEDVIRGDTNGAGEDNRNVARMAVLLAGLPETVPGVTVNRLCGSGAEAIVQAARAVRAGAADLMIAGGVESMTRAPFVIPKPDIPQPPAMQMYATQVGWRMVNPKFPDHWTASLGACAEAVAADLGISRAEQDEWALRSH